MAKLRLANDAKTDKESDNGCSPLIMSKKFGHGEVTKLPQAKIAEGEREVGDEAGKPEKEAKVCQNCG